MIWLLMGIAFAKPVVCEFGHELKVGKALYKKCEIIGHSGLAPTYYAHCDLQPEDRQLEFVNGESHAHWIDPMSRRDVALCDLRADEVKAMTQNYETRSAKVEKPPCYLTNWKGQLTLVAQDKPFRCSFKMNAHAQAEFEKQSGKKAAFQCEGEHFLVTAGAETTYAYEKQKGAWTVVCQPSKRVGEPQEAVDWKNPPAFYDPELDTPGLKSGSP